MIGEIIESVEGVFAWFENAFDTFAGIFSDIDFTILYSWLPSDIQDAISGIIVVLLFLAIIGLVKKIVVFFG